MWWEYLIGVGVLVLIVVLYVVTYKINNETKKPEDCEDLECSGCKTDNCSHRK